MKFPVSLVALISLASSVIADAATITAALSDVANDALAIKESLDAWDGGPLGTVPIIAGAANLVITVQKSTYTIKKSDSLSEDEALGVALATGDLITNTIPTLDTLVEARPKFDHLLLRPAIYLGLLSQKSEIVKLGDACIEKLPDVYKDIAEAIIDELLVKYDEVINAYKLL